MSHTRNINCIVCAIAGLFCCLCAAPPCPGQDKMPGILLDDFSAGLGDWKISGAARGATTAESPLRGAACLRLDFAERGEARLARPFHIHPQFKRLGVATRSSATPALNAEMSDGRVLPMTAEPPAAGGWTSHFLDCATIQPEPTKFWGGTIQPEPLYIEAIRVSSGPGRVDLDVLHARFEKSEKEFDPYMAAGFPGGKAWTPGAAPELEAVIFNLGSGQAQTVFLDFKVRNPDTPEWATVCSAELEQALDMPEGEGKRVVLRGDSTAPAGAYLARLAMRIDVKEKDKTVRRIAQSDELLVVSGRNLETAVVEDFEAVTGFDNWKIERRIDDYVPVAEHAAAGGALGAALGEEAKSGRKSLLLSASKSSAELFCLALPLSPAADEMRFWIKPLEVSGNAGLVLELAERYGKTTRHTIPLGQTGEWREVSVPLGVNRRNAPMALAGVGISGGAARVLIDDISETRLAGPGTLSVAFRADAPTTMMGLRGFADVYRNEQIRYFVRVFDNWLANETYYETRAGDVLSVELEAPALKGKPLDYQVLGAGTNAIQAGAVPLDNIGRGSIKVETPVGGLYTLEVSDGISRRFRRIMTVPRTEDHAEMAAACSAFAARRGVKTPEFVEPRASRFFGSIEEMVASSRNPPLHPRMQRDWQGWWGCTITPTQGGTNDAALAPDSLRVLASPLTPALVYEAPPGGMNFFADLDSLGLGGPTRLAYPVAGGTRVQPANRTDTLAGLSENWLLVWFHGAEGWDEIGRPAKPKGSLHHFVDNAKMNLDFPHLLIFNRKPASAAWQGGEGLSLEFKERAMVLLVPLYGANPIAAERTAGWAEKLPEAAAAQCRRWVKNLAWVPFDMSEYFALSGDDMVINTVYDYLRFAPDAAPAAAAAPVAPAVALASDAGLPVEYDGAVEDMDAVTIMGPYRVMPGKNECRYTLKGILRYVHEVEEAAPGPALGEAEWAAIRKNFNATVDVYDHRYHRAFRYADYAFYSYDKAGKIARSFPYLEPAARDQARQYLYRATRDFYLEPAGYTKGDPTYYIPIRGGGWGGDRLKMTAASLYHVWQFAYYGGPWQMIEDRWDLITRMNSAYQTWLIPGPTSWAEHFHHGAIPGSIALARMAYVMGDHDMYRRQSFLAAKLMVAETAWIQGAAPFIKAHQPWNQSYMNDAIPVVLSTVHGFLLGGITEKFSASPVGGSAYDGVQENFWVFGTDELLRFWRENLRAGTRHILDAVQNRAWPGWDEIKAGEQMPQRPSLWSLMKMKLLVLGEPAENPSGYLADRVHYSFWNGPDGAGSLPHIFSVLKNGFAFRRIIPAAEPGNLFLDGRTSPEVSVAYPSGLFSTVGTRGIAPAYPIFVTPVPNADWKWDIAQSSMFVGFHRAWKTGEEPVASSIACGNATVRQFSRP